jgi:hypothetical protein
MAALKVIYASWVRGTDPGKGTLISQCRDARNYQLSGAKQLPETATQNHSRH